HEWVGNKLVVSREYSRILDDNGLMAGLVPGIETSFRLRGATHNWRAIELEIDIFKNTVKVKWLEKPANYLLDADLPFRTKGDSSAETSGTTNSNPGSGSGGTTAVDAGALRKVPTANQYAAPTADIVPL